MTQEPEQAPSGAVLDVEADAPSDPAPGPTRLGPVVAITSLGVLLAIAFFPRLFDHVTAYDDEGFFLMITRRFLDHGGLYVHTKTAYGPFYFTFMGLIYRLTGQTPTLFSGRMIVLVLTTVSSGIFAAAVWRVTRSLPFAILGQVATFAVLIRNAGNEPSHPGSLIVLVLSVLVYALASYSMGPRTALLVIVGACIGALLMTKINVGVFAAAAVVVVFVVGNPQFPKWFRTIVAAAALVLPFALMTQLLWNASIGEFAVLVSVSLLLTYAPMQVDVLSHPPRALVTVVGGAAAAMVAASLWPLFNGTSPVALLKGILIRPLKQVGVLSSAHSVDLEWLAVLVTVCVVYIALGHREESEHSGFGGSWLPNAALALAGLWVLGLGLLGGFLAWLPAIALLPALAWISAVPATVRLALRFLVVVAILQILHAYPVPGSQRFWGLVVMCVPCVIAIAVAAERMAIWKQAGGGARAAAVGSLCALLVLGMGLWPPNDWHDYEANTRLGLPGARLVRVTPKVAENIQGLARVVKKRCDVFYSAPGFDSLYIYTGIAPLAGSLSNWPGVLTTTEQQEIATELARAQAGGQRACVVRDLSRQAEWLASSYGHGPLGAALAAYRARVALVGGWSVSVADPESAERVADQFGENCYSRAFTCCKTTSQAPSAISAVK